MSATNLEPEGLGPSSLALYRESVASPEAQKRPSTSENTCPRKKDFCYVNLDTGEVRPARCKANKCPYCGPVNARLVGGALGLAKPERAVLLTDVGNEWATIRNRAKQLTFHLRKATKAKVNWAWHVEPNPAGTGHHIHGWQWGDFVSQRALSSVASSVGMGKVAYINRVKAKDVGPLGYGLKLAGVAYGLKLAEAEATMGVYLEANGKRLVHASRGFWRGPEGKPYAGQREAMAAWASRQGSSENDERWVLVRKAHASG